MPDNTDDLKGRVKQAAGDLKGDKNLKNEGRVDSASAKVKQALDNATDKAKDALKKD